MKTEDRLKQQLEFILEIDKMKKILRQTILTDYSRQENDAEHSWHISVMAMVLAEYADQSVDIGRVIRMTLVHDLIEIYAGDTFAYDTLGNQDKKAREDAAADRLFAMLPTDQGMEIRMLWEEFDQMETPDAIFAAALDRLQPLLHNFVTEGHTWKRGVTSEQVRKRMAVIEKANPKLYEVVNGIIEQSLEKGYLTE
jgi:putative hydrolase of HD superfamily